MMEKHIISPANEMSVEGFFMNTISFDLHCKPIAAAHFLKLDSLASGVASEKRKRGRPKLSTHTENPHAKRPVADSNQELCVRKICDNSKEPSVVLERFNSGLLDEDGQYNGCVVWGKNLKNKRKKNAQDPESLGSPKKKNNAVEKNQENCFDVPQNSKKTDHAEIPQKAVDALEKRRSVGRPVRKPKETVASQALKSSRKETVNVEDATCNLSMILRKTRPAIYSLDVSDDNDDSWCLEKEMGGKARQKRGRKRKRGIKEMEPLKESNAENEQPTNGRRRGRPKKNKDGSEKKSANIEGNSKVSNGVVEDKEKLPTKVHQRGRPSTKNKDSEKKKEKDNSKGSKPKNDMEKEKQPSQTCKGNTNKTSKAETVKKPEECLITAKRGTLKHLKQHEEFLDAVANEAKCGDDFFSNDQVKKKSKLSKLISVLPKDTLSIKTPRGKKKSLELDEDPITPRTSFLGKWGVIKPSDTAYTPTHSSPEKDMPADKTAVLETMFHQLKDQNKRPRGIRKKSMQAYESVLHQPSKTTIELPSLPEIPGENGGDSSGQDDDYFNISEAI